MPTHTSDLVVLNRRMAKVIDKIICSMAYGTAPRHQLIKLHIMERVMLVEVKKDIEKILEQCKEDGY